MGTPLFPFALTLLAAVTAAPDPQVMREERFQSVLAEMDVAAAGRPVSTPASRLRWPSPGLARSAFGAASGDRFVGAGAGERRSPDELRCPRSRGRGAQPLHPPQVGDERRQWLLLRWRAAAAALDHRQAALALRRLVDGNLLALDAPLFPDQPLPDQGNGLDQLALHEAALGRNAVAVEVQLLGDLTGVQGASDWRGRRNGSMPISSSKPINCWKPPWIKRRQRRPGDWPWTCCINSCNCSWRLGAMASGRGSGCNAWPLFLMTAMRSSNCSRRPNPIPCCVHRGIPEAMLM